MKRIAGNPIVRERQGGKGGTRVRGGKPLSGTVGMLTRANGLMTDPHLNLKSILIPVDFSAGSNRALQYAGWLASQSGSVATVMTVIEPVLYPDFACSGVSMEDNGVVKSVRDRLSDLCRGSLIEPRLVKKTVVKVGSPFREICAAAAELKSDLIVIATHGYSGVRHLWLGSTAERVVRHAPCPVLVVRGVSRVEGIPPVPVLPREKDLQ